MSRLPLRPLGNKQTNDSSKTAPQPALGGGREVFVDDTVSPQLASTELLGGITPAQKRLPTPLVPPAPPEITSYKPKAPVTPEEPSTGLPQEAPVPVASAPEIVSEPRTEAPKAQEKPVAVQPIAPSIENITYTREEAYQDKLELQRRRTAAIAKLPTALKRSINRLFEHITDDTSSEVTLNGPKSVGFKRAGQRFIDNEIDFIDTDTYHAIINDFLLPLTNTHERIGSTPHLVEGQLNIPDPDDPTRPPMIARVHIVAPPAVQNAQITIAKKARNQLTIDSMVNSGTMTTDMGKFLKDLARGRATVVFSGVSGSGKTTALEAMSREFDVSDRIVLVEDVEELSLGSSSVVQLLSHQARPGEDPRNSVTLEWLVRQANRMRPDRIIVGEVRGSEMAEFLTAANSGADGSMTTVHANSPQEAINKMLSLSSSSESKKTEGSFLRDIASTVQVVVQLSILDGRHVVSQIEEVSNTVNKNTMGIQTSTIFKFDRNTGRFNFENRISDEFQMFLKQRGVEVANPSLNQRSY
jgi:Flp pilus assembly CpaF family ATPase